MALWLAKEFDWDTGRYTGRYYDIAEAGIVAVFVDSFYGDDASADPEDPDLPLKTLGAAITYLNTNGADGSRIFMNGIFMETVPDQTYAFQYIGCGGGRNGRTVWARNQSTDSRIIIRKRNLTRIENVETVNYENTNINVTNGNANNWYLLNCYLKFCYITGGNSTRTYGYFSIFQNVRWIHQGAITGGSGNIYYDCEKNTTGTLGGLSIYGTNHFYNQFKNHLGVDYTPSDSSIGSLTGIQPQFINPSQNNFNVRITSPLIGAGTVDEITGIAANVGGVEVGLPYNGITSEFTTEGGATITDLTIDANGKFTITPPAIRGTLETALMDLGNIYPLENIDLFNVFDFASGEITQGVFENFVSPRMALTIKLKYGLTSAEVDSCPWLLIEYGKQPTFSGTGASRVGNAADTFDPDTFQTITCRYMKLFVTLQNNS